MAPSRVRLSCSAVPRVLTRSLIVCLVGASGCRDQRLDAARGRLLVVQPAAGEPLDFGDVFVGQEGVGQVQLFNGGKAPLTVTEVSTSDARFRTSFSEALVIESGATADLVIRLAPKLEEAGAELSVKVEGQLVVSAADAAPPEDRVTVPLSGRVVSGACEVPGRLDFGRVELGVEARQTLTISNPTPVAVQVGTERIASDTGHQALFAQPAGTPSGQIPVAAGESVTLTFIYRPTEPLRASARVRVRASTQCPWVDVVLTGEGVREVLQWSPRTIDFGFVAPGGTAQVPVSFENASSQAIEVRLSASGDVSVAPGVLSVPGRGTAALTVTFAPTRVGAQAGAIQFVTTSRLTPEGSIGWEGSGGGPRVRVAPVPLIFGTVPFLAGGTAPVARRRLFIESVGTVSTDARAALVVTRLEVLGSSALTLEQPPMLPVLQAGARLDVGVLVSPGQAGPGSGTIRVTTNDPTRAAVDVPVTWDAVTTQPCELSIGPARLAFGLVTMPQRRELRVQITNLTRGPLQATLIAPGQRLEVPVAFSPTRQAPGLERRTGSLTVQIPSLTTPLVTVALDALAGSGCLVAFPDALDFATVPVGCRSAERVVQVINTCAVPVQVDALRLDGCSVTPCPITLGTTVHPVILGSTERLDVRLRAAPTVAGPVSGSLVALTGGSNAEELVVPLKLEASPQAVHTDTTRLPPNPLVDMLFVIDDSCSMAPKQNNLQTNFQALFSITQRSNTDFHFAVTTTDVDQGPRGRLIGDRANPTVLTSATPNLSTLFRQKVMVGVAGSSYEHSLAAAAAALSPALLQTTNAGFLRPDARLVVFFVTDANDQSVGPWEPWAARLFAVKGAFRRDALTVHGIIGLNRGGTAGHYNTPAPCPYDGPPDDFHPLSTRRYSRLIEQTGGERADICLIDWAPVLSTLGSRSFQVQSTFPLTTLPDSSSSVEVLVDGRLVPALQGNARVWTYLPESNTVRFEQPYLPVAGQSIDVRYQVVCQ